MQLKNDQQSKNLLDDAISNYYQRRGNRSVRNFLHAADPDGEAYYSYFLIERKNIIRYSIGIDRGMWLGALEMAIGPHYFGADAFWSYENYKRFSIDSTTEAVEKNLALLDEFWGYEWPQPKP